MYSNILLRGFKYFECIYFIVWKLQLLVEQNPVIPNINSGANIILYIIWVHKLYLLYYILYTNMWKCNMYYRPDMGWEPVWYGLWINKAELKIENLLKQFKLKGAIFKKKNDHDSFLHDDKNETEPIWLSPIFTIFQAPPCKVICINYAYNHIDVRPVYNK